MTVYVDPLLDRGWAMRGNRLKNCHLFTDATCLTELHTFATAIGCKRAWFQDAPAAPHYDLTPTRRAAAIAAGAVPVESRQAVLIWRARRAVMDAIIERVASEVKAG